MALLRGESEGHFRMRKDSGWERGCGMLRASDAHLFRGAATSRNSNRFFPTV